MDAVIKNTFAEVFINGKHFFSLQAADFEDADNKFWYTAFKNVVIDGDKARAQLSERAVDLIKMATKKYTDASDIIVEVAASDIIPVTTEQEESEEAREWGESGADENKEEIIEQVEQVAKKRVNLPLWIVGLGALLLLRK